MIIELEFVFQNRAVAQHSLRYQFNVIIKEAIFHRLQAIRTAVSAL